MIPHSQPYIESSLLRGIENLFLEKNLQSQEMWDEILRVFKDKFHQDNLYFTQSGSHSLYWIIKGLHLTNEDEVILPTYVCPSLYNAILSAGAKPVLCDIECYWHMSPATVQEKITKNTKAIIIVNLFGMSLDCAQFRYPGIVLINDLCQSFEGLKNKDYDNGDFIIYSFHPTKFITAGNGGGYSLVNPPSYFKNYLEKGCLDFSISNMNILILRQQLELYEEFVSKRKEIAQIYFSSIKKEYTKYIKKDNNAFYRFPLIQNDVSFEEIQESFEKYRVSVKRGVDDLIHRKIGLADDKFPNATLTYGKTVSIPIYPSLSLKDARYIASICSEL
jgi:perosamine synthetase